MNPGIPYEVLFLMSKDTIISECRESVIDFFGGNGLAAIDWFREPNVLLNNKSPIDLLMSERAGELLVFIKATMKSHNGDSDGHNG